MRKAVILLAAAALLSVAAAPKPSILVEQAQVRPPAGGLGTAAAYLTLKNTGDQPDRLVGAACDCARSTTLHQSVTRNGVSTMLDLKAVEIPAKGEVSFASSGRHLMLTGLKRPIKAGDTVSITLSFERSGAVKATFVAAAMAGMPGMGGTDSMQHHHH